MNDICNEMNPLILYLFDEMLRDMALRQEQKLKLGQIQEEEEGGT